MYKWLYKWDVYKRLASILHVFVSTRKIKLEDPCIKDRKDDNSVMCVIIGVRKTKDEVVIERIDGQSGNMSADVKVKTVIKPTIDWPSNVVNKWKC